MILNEVPNLDKKLTFNFQRKIEIPEVQKLQEEINGQKDQFEINEEMKKILLSRNTTITDIKHEDSTFNKEDKYIMLSHN